MGKDDAKDGPGAGSGEVVDFAAARRAAGKSGGAARQARKEAARAEKAKKAAANRARFGRTKAEKARDRQETGKSVREIEGHRRAPEDGPDDAGG